MNNNTEIKTIKVENNVLYINDNKVPSGYVLRPEDLDIQSLMNLYTWAMDTYLKKINIDGVCESCQL